ncbi:MAG: ATPase, T2SS/T4P/T4SS family [Candidatus Omnitrophota bacterium]|jgi:flagellar protein FlaI|nr:ATPase, T2SS/T4P/T4SS family [Candidatus Omnitrophota bacterium]
MEKRKVDIEARILEKILGRINLLQNDSEKKNIVSDVISELYGATKEDTFLQSQALSELSNEAERETFIDKFFSYGIIEDLLRDPDVEDIIINSLKPIYVHHTYKGLTETDKRFTTPKELDVFIKKLVVFSGRESLKKLNNLELSNIQGRVNIAMSPFGPQITITKIKENPLSIIDLIRKGAMNYDIAALFWLYMEGMSIRPANILILGAPGSGKTTLLNALLSFVPSKERLVIIEDTLELNTLREDSWSRMESDDEVTLADLVKNSLRMRPERIVVGEVRGEEAQDLMTAMNIGKYCMGTIHASAAREAIIRLENEPMNIPETLVNLVDVFITLVKFHVKDQVFRVVAEIAETAGMEQKKVLLSAVWRYDYESHAFIEDSPTSVFRDKVARASGMNALDVIRELKMRSEILKILDNKDVSDMEDVCRFFRLYNKDADEALKSIDLTKAELMKNVHV